MQCHRCQGFGHSHTSCEAKGPACGICGRDHHTSHCIERKHNGEDVPRGCANCGIAGHSAPSYYCPARKQHLRGSKSAVPAKPSMVDACHDASEPTFELFDIKANPGIKLLPHEREEVMAEVKGFCAWIASRQCSFALKPLPPVAVPDVSDEEEENIDEEEEEPSLPTETPTQPGQKRPIGSPDLSEASSSSESIDPSSAEQPDASMDLDRFYKVVDSKKKKRKTDVQDHRKTDVQASSSKPQASPRLESPRQVNLPHREGTFWCRSKQPSPHTNRPSHKH